ncbi:hypothetical protein V1478_017816 [Vespula squamosa]|uniref:Uncharacterized protein n=1 Tax=Vespula squamosa TaxID=30214 RepID=A0ABD1ZVA5_VESSQ
MADVLEIIQVEDEIDESAESNASEFIIHEGLINGVPRLSSSAHVKGNSKKYARGYAPRCTVDPQMRTSCNVDCRDGSGGGGGGGSGGVVALVEGNTTVIKMTISV